MLERLADWLWDAATAKPIGNPLAGHKDAVLSAAGEVALPHDEWKQWLSDTRAGKSPLLPAAESGIEHIRRPVIEEELLRNLAPLEQQRIDSTRQ